MLPLVKLQALKITLPHGWFLRFWNCTDGRVLPEFTRKASLKSFHPFDSRKKNWLLIFFQATWKQRCMQTKNYCKKQIPKRSFTWQSWNGGKQYFQSKHSRHLRDRLKLLQANKKSPTAFKKVVGESLFSIFDQFRDITLVLSHTILSKFLILIRHTNVSKPLVQTLSRDIEMEHGCKMGQWF